MDLDFMFADPDPACMSMSYAGFADDFSRKVQLRFAVNLLQTSSCNFTRDIGKWVCSFFTVDKTMYFIEKVFKAKESDIERIDDFDDMGHCFAEYWNKGGKKTAKHKRVVKELGKLLADWDDKDSVLNAKINEVRTVFRLSDLDQDILLFFYMKAHEPMFSEAVCDLANYMRRSRKANVHILSAMCGRSVFELTDALKCSSPLRKFGLIDDDLDLTQHIGQFLNGFSGSAITSQFFTQYDGDVLPLSYHTNVTDHIDVLQALVQNRKSNRGTHVLLYGKPGTGKTTLVQSLTASLGKTLYEINVSSEERTAFSKGQRISALYACENTIDLEKSVILVDEADDMLNSGGGLMALFGGEDGDKKGRVNEFIDRSKSTCIWITNSFNGISESVRRRFDYSIEFNAPTTKQRALTWKLALERYHAQSKLKAGEIRMLAERYPVCAGGIDVAVRNLATLGGVDGFSPVKAAETVLKQHTALMNLSENKDEVKPVKRYTLKGLNVKSDMPLNEITDILRHFSKHLQATPDPEIRNMNVLLYGPPGTGKTEFAKYLSTKVGRPVIVKRASDLLDMYVGQTEKMIRDTFRRAEKDGAILFLDEADSLLQGREYAARGWEISQVNEILVGMESFKGILVCSTNFKDRLDSASLRRFNLKVQFDYLEDTGKVTFWNTYLKPVLGNPLRGKNRRKLLEIGPLTPGDFKVVWQKYSFFSKDKISTEIFLAALENEVRHRGADNTTAIGFSG